MISHEIQLRIRYGETDQMGFCYYGNYAQFLEVARVETLRKFGISYKELEEKGILLPVRNFSIKYIAPAKYDDIIHIQTVVNEIKAKAGVKRHQKNHVRKRRADIQNQISNTA